MIDLSTHCNMSCAIDSSDSDSDFLQLNSSCVSHIIVCMAIINLSLAFPILSTGIMKASHRKFIIFIDLNSHVQWMDS